MASSGRRSWPASLCTRVRCEGNAGQVPGEASGECQGNTSRVGCGSPTPATIGAGIEDDLVVCDDYNSKDLLIGILPSSLSVELGSLTKLTIYWKEERAACFQVPVDDLCA
jgi:hypothetical protein